MQMAGYGCPTWTGLSSKSWSSAKFSGKIGAERDVARKLCQNFFHAMTMDVSVNTGYSSFLCCFSSVALKDKMNAK